MKPSNWRPVVLSVVNSAVSFSQTEVQHKNTIKSTAILTDKQIDRPIYGSGTHSRIPISSGSLHLEQNPTGSYFFKVGKITDGQLVVKSRITFGLSTALTSYATRCRKAQTVCYIAASLVRKLVPAISVWRFSTAFRLRCPSQVLIKYLILSKICCSVSWNRLRL